MTLLFLQSVVQGQAQITDKTQNKESKKEVKETKKELKRESAALKKLEGNNVSSVAKNNFSTDFGNMSNVKWKRLGTFDEATFTKNGKEMKAFYDYDGKMIGTTSVITFDDLPVTGQTEIKTRYKDYSVAKVVFFKDNIANQTDMILYGIQFDDVDCYFVELKKGTDKIVVKAKPDGEISYFTIMK
jgi:hypothetical protein